MTEVQPSRTLQEVSRLEKLTMAFEIVKALFKQNLIEFPGERPADKAIRMGKAVGNVYMNHGLYERGIAEMDRFN